MKIRQCMKDVSKIKGNIDTALSIDPTEYVDVLFGVGSATSAGPTLPAGSIHPSPETLEKDCGGYTRAQPIIGFGQAYISGSGGTKCYGNYLLAPMVEDIELDSAKRASFAVEGSEKARCYEYTVTLDNGIKTSVAPARNSAIYSFEYPADKDCCRTAIYAKALDDVMKLAVELPTYQRNDCVAYNPSIIDYKSLNSDPTAFAGVIDKIWELDYVD